MKRWIKWLVYFAGGVVLLLGLLILTEHLRGERALKARLNALAAQGEILSVTALTPKRPAPDQNLFLDLLPLTNHLGAIVTNLEFAPPLLRFAAPGRAIAVAQLDEWKAEGTARGDWKLLSSALEPAGEILTALKQAVQKPHYDSGFNYENGFVDFHLLPVAELLHACKLLSWFVLQDLKRGNLEAAHQNLLALVTLTAQQTPEPLVICQLVRHACAALALNATWQALQVNGWSDAQLASLQAQWQSCDLVKDMADAIEMERAMTLDLYSQIRRSKEKMDFVLQKRLEVEELTDGAFGKLPTHGFVLHWFHLPVWKTAWAAQDELASLEKWQYVIGRERLARTNGWAVLAKTDEGSPLPWWLNIESPEDLGWYDRLKFLFANQDFAITDTLIRKILSIQTQQQMTLAALGIQRYRLRIGRLPPNLLFLVPEYMAAVPHDFMDAKSLRYRLLQGDKDFVLYSVGEDGKDEGGNPMPPKETDNYRLIWHGRDAVWPSAATAAEAKAALGTSNQK